MDIASFINSSVWQELNVNLSDAFDTISYSYDYKDHEDNFYLTATFSGDIVLLQSDGSSQKICFKFEEKYRVNHDFDKREFVFTANDIWFFNDDKLKDSIHVFVNDECLEFDHPLVSFLLNHEAMTNVRYDFVNYVNNHIDLSVEIKDDLSDTIDNIFDEIADSKSYNDDPYAYYGMSRSDFY